jgi:microcin C transport system substrate-binding protein
LDLRLDGLEETVAYKKEMEKQHELSFGSWSITPPVPNFREFLHSSNAFTEKGNVKTQTNNTFCWSRADTDALCEIARNARTVEELKNAAWKLQHIIHDEAIFIPGFTTDFIRIASWRWVRWPNCEGTRFSPSVVYDPHELHLFWIDADMQRETLDARHRGREFPETNSTFDQFRIIDTP